MANVGGIRKGYMFINKHGELKVVEHPIMIESDTTYKTIHTIYYGGYARNMSGTIVTDPIDMITK